MILCVVENATQVVLDAIQIFVKRVPIEMKIREKILLSSLSTIQIYQL